jgi:prolyl-tRNA synthetase
VRLGQDEQTIQEADSLYATLQEKGIEVLYDDRDARAGEKFADADLMGIPYRVVVSAKAVESGKYECKARTASEAKMFTTDEIIKTVQSQESL